MVWSGAAFASHGSTLNTDLFPSANVLDLWSTTNKVMPCSYSLLIRPISLYPVYILEIAHPYATLQLYQPGHKIPPIFIVCLEPILEVTAITAITVRTVTWLLYNS